MNRFLYPPRLQDFAAQLLLPNVYTGYAYLLDKDNRVRWRGSGQALEGEVEVMLLCAQELLQER
jgi:ATPase complex subunit ATP10